MKKLKQVVCLLVFGLVVGYVTYKSTSPAVGELATVMILSFLGMVFGWLIFNLLLENKRFFPSTSNNGLIFALGGFTLMLVGPYVATRVFGGQLASDIWFGIIFIYGMMTGAIIRFGAPDFENLLREDQEKFHRKQAGLEPRG